MNVDVDLSPAGSPPVKVQSMAQLKTDSTGRQIVEAYVAYVVPNFYDMCPAVGCGKKIVYGKATWDTFVKSANVSTS